MNAVEHIRLAMNEMKAMASATAKEHRDYMRVINEERVVKEELIEQLGYVLKEAFATLATQNSVRLHSRRSGDERGTVHLEFAYHRPDDGARFTMMEPTYMWLVTADGYPPDIVSPEEIVEAKWPIEQVFAKAHDLLLESYEGLRLERLIEVRAVTAVLKGVSGAWKRGGLVG